MPSCKEHLLLMHISSSGSLLQSTAGATSTCTSPTPKKQRLYDKGTCISDKPYGHFVERVYLPQTSSFTRSENLKTKPSHLKCLHIQRGKKSCIENSFVLTKLMLKIGIIVCTVYFIQSCLLIFMKGSVNQRMNFHRIA